METLRLRRWGVAGTLVGALAIGGCGSMDMATGRDTQTWTMTTSDSVQAAQGKVKVHREKDGNALVKVEVERLAPPSVVQEDSVAYVVWLQPSGGQPQNVGTLKVDGKKLKGDLETKTPFKHFQVMVTAEKGANVTQPSGPEVMDVQITVPT